MILAHLKTYLSLAILAAALWLMHGFIPALLWAVVIAIATWPLRGRLARSLNRVAVAAIMTGGVALLLFFPIVYALTHAVLDLGRLTTWLLLVQQTGIAVPQWLHTIPQGGRAGG